MAIVQALALTLLVLLLHTTTAASYSQTATISYHAHYPVASERPNTCGVAFRSEPRNVTYTPGQYIPFIGTSISRDSQLLVMRLLYSLDYPVKHFMVVVPRRALQGSHAMAYELKHLKQYGSNIIIIACEHPPSVTEGWNAVFHTLPNEPWGIYNARDTAWEPGSLAKAAEQFWPLATAGEAYSNLEPWPAEMAKFNVFMLTRSLVQRFGYFDESIYPAYCEDDDFVYRLKLLQPPGVMQQLKDVYVIHGARSDKQYNSGIFLSSEEGKTEEHTHSSMAMRKGAANCNYFLRKWGCRSELAKQWVRSLHNTCKYTTPFGKDVPVWFWRTSRKERELDKEIELRELDKGARREVWDIKADRKIFDVPEHYGTWGGYYEPCGICRLTGELGRISSASPNPVNNSSPAPNCL